MAKYTYTENGITFNNLDSAPNPKLDIPGKLVHNDNDFEYASEDGIKPVVNAVEIDWNGATSDMGVINTTGELISYLATA